MRYSTVLRYIEAATECEMAMRSRRPSLVHVDDVARIGELAFDGADGEERQMAVDRIVREAGVHADGAEPERRALAEDDPSEGTFDPAVAKAMLHYATATAQSITTREARVHGTDATRSDAHPHANAMHYVGVWERGTYRRGATATHDGTLWYCDAESTIDRPGSSKSWRLMVKNKERASR